MWRKKVKPERMRMMTKEREACLKQWEEKTECRERTWAKLSKEIGKELFNPFTSSSLYPSLTGCLCPAPNNNQQSKMPRILAPSKASLQNKVHLEIHTHPAVSGFSRAIPVSLCLPPPPHSSQHHQTPASTWEEPVDPTLELRWWVTVKLHLLPP